MPALAAQERGDRVEQRPPISHAISLARVRDRRGVLPGGPPDHGRERDHREDGLDDREASVHYWHERRAPDPAYGGGSAQVTRPGTADRGPHGSRRYRYPERPPGSLQSSPSCSELLTLSAVAAAAVSAPALAQSGGGQPPPDPTTPAPPPAPAPKLEVQMPEKRTLHPRGPGRALPARRPLVLPARRRVPRRRPALLRAALARRLDGHHRAQQLERRRHHRRTARRSAGTARSSSCRRSRPSASSHGRCASRAWASAPSRG